LKFVGVEENDLWELKNVLRNCMKFAGVEVNNLGFELCVK